MKRRVPFFAAIAIASLVPATPASAGHVTTEVSDVRGVSTASGGKTMVTYRVRHDVNGHVAPFTALPGARVPRTSAFDGMWGDGAFFAAWLAPNGPFRFQFEPNSWMVENSYFTNWTLQEPEAIPLEAGDRFDIAVGNSAWDAPLPSRPRGTPTGTLQWDHAVDSRVVTAKQGANQAEMTALFFRADVVARGGDVDARRGAIHVPPLVIDLPQTYPKQVQGSYMVSVFSPYTRYLSGSTMRVNPASGKAVLTVNARGYIHQARERRLPGGADIKEWHLPMSGVIMLSAADDPAVGTMSFPAPGEALIGDLTSERRVQADAGQRLTLGPDLVSSLDGAPAQADATGAAPDEIAEIEQADMIDRTLSQPTEIEQGNGKYRVTLDPDFRGEGVLALRSVRRRDGTTFADVFSLPYAVVNGQAMKLDRSRLVDLRVMPRYPEITIGFTGGGGAAALNKTRTFFSSSFDPGLVVEAVYDLGNQRYLFVSLTGAPDPNASPSVVARTQTISFGLDPVQARPVYHVEVPGGEVVYDGEVRTTSFQAPLDLLGDHRAIDVGGRTLTSSVIRTGSQGRVTVLPAPAELTAEPSAQPGAALDGPVALLYSHPEDYPASWNRSSVARITVNDVPQPAANPKPIGTGCGTSQAVDHPAPDAIPALDILEGWFDADDANLYATLKLRAAPTAPPEGAIYRWSLNWGYGSHNWFARANLAADGKWTFDHGGFVGSFFKTKDVSGETSGEFIRIRVPRSVVEYANGETLIDTGAHSWMTSPPTQVTPQGLTQKVDSAPQDADPTWGMGGSYTVGTC